MQNSKTNFIHSFLFLILGALFFVFLSSSATANEQKTAFLDVTSEHQYYVPIDYLKGEDVVKGYEDGTFKAEAMISRAESLKLILDGSQIALNQNFESHYPDVLADQWFSPYVMTAHQLGIVKGNDENGMFLPLNTVNLAEFTKMLLVANGVEISTGQEIPNLSEAWYTSYLNRAFELGLFPLDANGTVDPSKNLTRGDVSQMIYLFAVMKKGNDSSFLLSEARKQWGQIEVYIQANHMLWAKTVATYAVEFTQQAYQNNPSDPIILGDAKLARAYDWLVDSIIYGIEGQDERAAQKANEVIDKATEAWEANHDIQPIAAHIKAKAREVLTQVGGVEN